MRLRSSPLLEAAKRYMQLFDKNPEKMNILKIALIIIFTSLNAFGQTCSYENLSREFNYKVVPISKKEDLIQLVVQVTEKQNSKRTQTFKIECEGFYLDSFDNCKNVRSYITKVNSKLPSGDEKDSGNFIVADFNFDSFEDFAIKSDPGGNGGPLYTYFLQAENKKFYRSNYLSDTVQFFPIEINPINKTLTTFLHANAYQKNRRIFKYNLKAKKWKLIHDGFEE
ncbi:hypothetical protein [Flavobacterium sp.]|uniref:XAC2610-related protein n=2 Tax=Flavobacterium sp. TaxID=239 RepID=UPI002487437E|nr:hypothetical protein [Flavobacterium sp.]MDI1318459.1 hypothetical protein [Flavobacterium sp.]